MLKINQRHQKTLVIFLKKNEMRSSEVYGELIKLREEISQVTVKRILYEMCDVGLLIKKGAGRSTSYSISSTGRIFVNIDALDYVAVEPDKRYGLNQYNFELLKSLPFEIFTEAELKKLETATAGYRKRAADLSAIILKKELERLVIELSWKSSKIEGNTYTLLDTEKLILENKEAPGHSREEARMILNHKDAFDFIRHYSDQFKTVTRKNLETLHAILMKDLSVSLGFRSKPVGVTGSVYRPLDNIYQIGEAIDDLSRAVFKNKTPYGKAFIALLGLSYIQPFEDGNKRTARLMANALLLSHSRAPLSYRSVDEKNYRAATLVFYELNSIVPMKKIFISQYEFAAQNYSVK